jgi:hypothetical protein
MHVPVWIKPAVWGAVFGAVGMMIVGFYWMGWTLGHTTTRLVAEGSESAVIAALTPFCVANYLKQPDAAMKLALLREDTSMYTQRDIIEKAGFATMPRKHRAPFGTGGRLRDGAADRKPWRSRGERPDQVSPRSSGRSLPRCTGRPVHEQGGAGRLGRAAALDLPDVETCDVKLDPASPRVKTLHRPVAYRHGLSAAVAGLSVARAAPDAWEAIV